MTAVAHLTPSRSTVFPLEMSASTQATVDPALSPSAILMRRRTLVSRSGLVLAMPGICLTASALMGKLKGSDTLPVTMGQSPGRPDLQGSSVWWLLVLLLVVLASS